MSRVLAVAASRGEVKAVAMVVVCQMRHGPTCFMAVLPIAVQLPSCVSLLQCSWWTGMLSLRLCHEGISWILARCWEASSPVPFASWSFLKHLVVLKYSHAGQNAWGEVLS